MATMAIIEAGGKQYSVTEGAVLTLDFHPEVSGTTVQFDKVLLIDDGASTKVGAPHLSGTKVSGEIIEEGKSAKVRVIHYRQKSRHFKKAGHRQAFAKVKIVSIA